MIQNRAYTTSQISDLTEKLIKAENSVSQRASVNSLAPGAVRAAQSANANANGKGKEQEHEQEHERDEKASKHETSLQKVVKDSSKITVECHHGLM